MNDAPDIYGLSSISDAEFESIIDAMVPRNLDAIRRERSVARGPLEQFLDALSPLQEFLRREYAPLERVYGDWFIHPGLGLIYGPSGLGKSWVAMAMSLSLASGAPFLGMTPPRSYRVLCLDGEMGAPVLQDRLRRYHCTEQANLWVQSVPNMEMELNRSINLADRETQALFFDWLDRGLAWDPEVIVLDNLSTLFRGVEDNSNSEVSDRILDFIVRLAKRVSVVVVDHQGKKDSRGPRGASRKFDRGEWSLKLEEATGHLAKISLEKKRHSKIEGFAFVLDLVEAPGLGLELRRDVKIDDKDQALLGLIHQERVSSLRSLTEAAKGRGEGWGRSSIDRRLNRLVAKGLVDKGPPVRLTSEGEHLFPSQDSSSPCPPP